MVATGGRGGANENVFSDPVALIVSSRVCKVLSLEDLLRQQRLSGLGESVNGDHRQHEERQR